MKKVILASCEISTLLPRVHMKLHQLIDILEGMVQVLLNSCNTGCINNTLNNVKIIIYGGV
jgi:hypothetical protein